MENLILKLWFVLVFSFSNAQNMVKKIEQEKRNGEEKGKAYNKRRTQDNTYEKMVFKSLFWLFLVLKIIKNDLKKEKIQQKVENME